MGMHHIINGFNGGLSRDERLSNLCGLLHGARAPLSPLNAPPIQTRAIDEARKPNLPAVAINCISLAFQGKRIKRKNYPHESEINRSRNSANPNLKQTRQKDPRAEQNRTA
jgi:hypothetical protein